MLAVEGLWRADAIGVASRLGQGNGYLGAIEIYLANPTHWCVDSVAALRLPFSRCHVREAFVYILRSRSARTGTTPASRPIFRRGLPRTTQVDVRIPQTAAHGNSR